jgi:hypothetical protein
MRPVFALFAALIFLVTAEAPAKMTAYTGNDEETAAAAHDLELSLDLWRDGRFQELYERTIPAKGHGRESFARTLSGSFRKPACCWEKIREVQVTLKDDRQASVRAKFGIEETGTGTDYVTRSVKMVKEDGIWKVAMGDILKLAAGKKAKLRKAKVKKAGTHHRKAAIVRVSG